MNNFIVAFAVYLNLIFIVAKLWDKINWSWWLVMLPMTLITILGFVYVLTKATDIPPEPMRDSGKSNAVNKAIKEIEKLTALVESIQAGRQNKRQ